MFALLVADKTMDNDWAGDYYARTPSKALNSADALYVPRAVAAETLSTIIKNRQPKPKVAKAKTPDCKGAKAVACAFQDTPGSHKK